MFTRADGFFLAQSFFYRPGLVAVVVFRFFLPLRLLPPFLRTTLCFPFSFFFPPSLRMFFVPFSPVLPAVFSICDVFGMSPPASRATRRLTALFHDLFPFFLRLPLCVIQLTDLFYVLIPPFTLRRSLFFFLSYTRPRFFFSTTSRRLSRQFCFFVYMCISAPAFLPREIHVIS